MSASTKLLDDIAMRVLHRVAWLALRVQSPLEARRTVLRLGSKMTPFSGVAEAQRAASCLGRKGSCLSRSLAIAARLRDSSVVIGVDVRHSAVVSAHAWVELESEIVDGSPGVPRGERLASF